MTDNLDNLVIVQAPHLDSPQWEEGSGGRNRHGVSLPLSALCATLVLLLFSLAACKIEGGVARSTPSPTLPPVVPTEPTSTTVPTVPIPTKAVPVGGFRIGLMNEPDDLLPYHTDATDERITAPVSELLFPAPLLTFGYTYTTTGVLEQVPSFENGGIITREVEVYLDQTGAIIAPVADAITLTRTFNPTPGITQTQEIVITGEISPTQEITSTLGVTTGQRIAITSGITTAQQVVVTYRWNPLLHWSDGVPVTANDSLFAYEVAQRSESDPQAASRLSMMHRYESVDEHTTRAYLKPGLFPIPISGETFTDFSVFHSCWTPLPRHILSSNEDDLPTLASLRISPYGWLPIGYGPYQVDSRDEASMTLRRNPHYPNNESLAQAVSLVFVPDAPLLRSMVISGSIDIAVVELSTPDLLHTLSEDEAASLLNVAYQPAPIWEHIDFNLDVSLFQDIRVRHAIAYGTDRQAMVESLFNGAVPVLDSWIVPEHWAAVSPDLLTRYAHDPEQATQLLEEAGLLDSDGDGLRELDNGDPLTITLITSQDSPLREQAATMFQEDMAAIGLRVAVLKVPAHQLYSLTGPLFLRQFELALFAWIASPDPGGAALWSCRAVPTETNNWTGNNFSGWCFRDADRAIRVAATSWNREERLQAYLQQQQLFTQELPVLPLFQRLVVTLMSPGLRGVRPDPTAPITWNIATWSRE